MNYRIFLSVVLLLTAGVLFSAVKIPITVYNALVSSKVSVEQALDDLDSIYQRRYALVDNLVAIVKETKAFERYQIEIEKDLYPRVAEVKAQATRLMLSMPEEAQQRIGKETQISNALMQTLDNLLVLAQHFPTISDPTLKDRSVTFTALTGLKESLQELEQDIQHQRQRLNDAVRVYNQNRQIFPANLVASTWGFTPLAGFEVLTPAAREDVHVVF